MEIFGPGSALDYIVSRGGREESAEEGLKGSNSVGLPHVSQALLQKW